MEIIEPQPPLKQTNNELYWSQGFFSFGSQSRAATLTACKFLTDNLIVVAHRANAKLYLVDIIKKNIVSELELKISEGVYFHPDLLTIFNGKIYIDSYRTNYLIVKIIDNKFVIDNVAEIHPYCRFHGIFSDDETVYFGSVDVDDTKRTFVIDLEGNKKYIDFSYRVKGFAKKDNIHIYACDGKTLKKKWLFDSYILLYNGDEFLDKITIKNSQTDDIIIYKNNIYFSIHSEDEKCGFIYKAKYSSGKIEILKKYKTDSFPHGIDIRNDVLIYTTYSTSKLCIINLLEDFF